MEKLKRKFPGVEVSVSHMMERLPEGTVIIPEKYNVGHEAHFAQVTEDFLRYLKGGKLPSWEVPNMLAKYYTTTEAYRLSHAEK